MHVKNIGQHELLMLLLVVDPCTDRACAFLESRVACVVEKRAHARIRFMTVIENLIERGATEHPAPGSRMLLADGVVVGIEEDLELLARRPIRVVAPKKERFEKPAGVAQMPFGRAHVLHRLDQRLLGRDRRSENLRF